MDIRKRKTRQAIKSAFLQLRKTKRLEEITVKELSVLAQISKATFYLHYKDIFDLSESLQMEVIEQVLSQVQSPLDILTDRAKFSRDMAKALEQEHLLVSALFSDTQASALPIRLEAQIKRAIFSEYPHLKDNARLNVQLSYHIQGGYYAYMENAHAIGMRRTQKIIDDIHSVSPIILEEEQ